MKVKSSRYQLSRGEFLGLKGIRMQLRLRGLEANDKSSEINIFKSAFIILSMDKEGMGGSFSFDPFTITAQRDSPPAWGSGR